jgi:hypothetical protein
VEKTAVADAVRRHAVATIAFEVVARSAWVAQPATNNASARVQSIRIIGLQSAILATARHAFRRRRCLVCRDHLQSCDPRLF